MKVSSWMLRAIRLAEKGRGRVEPNPKVGAILLDKKGQCIAEGYHRFFGGPHAEVEALRRAGKKAQGGTLFVTLEPCSTYGKTPPCTDLILRSGVKKVVVGTDDPNPEHRGRGIRILKRAGIKVVREKADGLVQEQNAEFFKWMKSGLPLVTLKMAESLDGKIATSSGESRWITSLESRKYVQKIRRSHEAILVGTGTLLKDKPGLRANPRVEGLKGRSPRRIFVARDPNQLKGYLKANDDRGDVLFYDKALRFKLKNIQLVKAPFRSDKVALNYLLKFLSKMGISSLLVEGGGEMAASFLEGGFVDRVYFFIAPLLIGGRDAKTSFEGKGFKKLARAVRLKNVTMKKLGADFLIQAEVQK